MRSITHLRRYIGFISGNILDFVVFVVLISSLIYAVMNIYIFEIEFPIGIPTYTIKGGWLNYLAVFILFFVFAVLIFSSKRIKISKAFKSFLFYYYIFFYFLY